MFLQNKKEIIRLQDRDNLGNDEKICTLKIEGDILKDEKDLLGAIQYYSKAIEIDNKYHDALLKEDYAI